VKSYLGALPQTHPAVAQAYVELAALQLEGHDGRAALATVHQAALDVDSSAPAVVARATLIEAKVSRGKPAVAKARAVWLKLEARAPKDASVKALGEWLRPL